MIITLNLSEFGFTCHYVIQCLCLTKLWNSVTVPIFTILNDSGNFVVSLLSPFLFFMNELNSTSLNKSLQSSTWDHHLLLPTVFVFYSIIYTYFNLFSQFWLLCFIKGTWWVTFSKGFSKSKKDLLLSVNLLMPLNKLQKVCRAELQFANATVAVSKCITF